MGSGAGRLVEREEQLGELLDLLAECDRGAGGAAVVTGGVGCGKTALLDAVRLIAAERGFVVLDAVASWAERASAATVLHQLLRGPELPGEGIAGLREELRGCANRLACGEPGEPDDLDGATAAVLHALCAWLVRLAADVPVLVCVDDVQFADGVSLHWLLRLLRRVRTARVAVVVTECVLSKPMDPRLRAELLRLGDYRRIPVGLLSEDGLAELLGVPVGQLGDTHTASAGNPLLVCALADDNRHGAPPREWVPGDAYASAVLGCLYRGRPVLRRLARALALLDTDAGVPGVLTGVLDGVEVATVERGTEALFAAGLLARGGRIRHPAARRAIAGSVAPHHRTALHLRAAELLHARGTPPPRVCEHLLAAGCVLPAWTVPVLREAARHHMGHHRPAEAHRCLDAALAACRDERERVAVAAVLVGVAWVLNPSVAAGHLGDLVAAARTGLLPDRHTATLAKCLLWHGRFDEAATAVARLGERDAAVDPVGAAEARATRELLWSSYPGLPATGGRRPAPRAQPEADPRMRAAAALSSVLAGGPDERAVADAESALQALRSAERLHEWALAAVTALEFADRLPAAADWCDRWSDRAREQRIPLWEAEFAALRASIALRQGRPVAARALAEAALAAVPAAGWGVRVGGPVASLVQAATDTGADEVAAGHLRAPCPEGMFQTRFGLHYLHARGRHHLAGGRPHAALDDFLRCGDLARGWGLDQPSVVPWRSSAAAAHLRLGETRRARALAKAELAVAGTHRARGIALRALAAVADPAEGTRLLTEAVEALRAAGDRLQLARALADLGGLHLRAGRPGRARPVLEVAAGLAAECGAKPLLRDLPTVDGEPTPHAAAVTAERDTALSRLSGAERRVAALAARGHTNREIAERLSVTTSTVEQHLTRVFRKLGIRAREDLPAEIMLETAA